MTPTKFLQQRNIVAKDKTDLIIGFDNGSKESLIELLNSYHVAKCKSFGISNVLNKTRLLLSFSYWLNTNKINNAKKHIDIEEVEEYLKSNNYI